MIDPAATARRCAKGSSRSYGLDQPLWQQYFTFLANVARGDLGTSMVYDIPVTTLVFSRLERDAGAGATSPSPSPRSSASPRASGPATGPTGRRPRRSWRCPCSGSRSRPSGSEMLLIMLFAVELGWLPSGGRGDVGSILGIPTSLATPDGWSHVILPAINLSLFKMGLMIRLTPRGHGRGHERGLRALRPHGRGCRTARSCSATCCATSRSPIVTVFGLELGSTLAFAVVTETDPCPGVRQAHRPRSAAHRPAARPAGDGLLPRLRRDPLRAHQPRGGPRLRAARPARAPDGGWLMADAASTAAPEGGIPPAPPARRGYPDARPAAASTSGPTTPAHPWRWRRSP